jgi:hypothetical protein
MNVKCLIFITILTLSACSKKTEAPPVPPGPTAQAPTPPPAPAEEVTPAPAKPEKEDSLTALGTFTNRKGDGEHAWGYEVDLWKQDDEIFGLITGANDLMLDGDPPSGFLEDVKYDPKTGRISFRSKLSISGDSHDIYEFAGVLTAKQLTGVITVTEENCRDCREKVRVVLPRSREESEELEEYKTLEDWNAYKDPILKRRGPNW